MAERRYYRIRNSRSLFLWWLLKTAGYLVLAGFIFLAGAFIVFSRDLPSPDQIEDRFISQSTKIYDRTGKVILYDIFGEEKRTVIPFEEIPETVKQATIAIEDQNFYTHPGIDFKAIIRAGLEALKGERLRGASTITQQFVKNSILSPERTITRKVKEIILALELERRYSKDEILGFYLNQIPYGSNAYGVEAAARTFFAKEAKDLTLAESALLAALPQAPSYYSPYGSHPEELKARQELVLEHMVNLNFVSPEEAEEARRERLNFSETRTGINAPHFVFYVRDMLEEMYGEDYLARAGLKIITTLDWDLQQLAEKAVAEGAQRNEARGGYNAALVAIDPKTGQILSMVGSRDFNLEPIPAGCTPGLSCKFEPYVNVTTSSRQPGSSIKPFIYATAFKKGFTDRTVLFDVPTEFNSFCSPQHVPLVADPNVECYHPRNYDGRFRGPVSLRTALANSINVPSVKLLHLAGVDDSINTAQDMGITTLGDRSRFGLSLVLGGGEVRLLELTAAYGVFATEGVRHPTTAILRIEDSQGKVIFEPNGEPSQVMDAEVTRLISNILSDNEARQPIFGPASSLYFKDRPVAAKTGTTNEFRDGWTLGYTPSLAVGIWAGNNDNTPLDQEPGAMVAAPIWREFLLGAFEALKMPVESFTPPVPKISENPVLNGEYAPQGETHTILHYLNKSDSLYSNWEAAVRSWIGGVSTTTAAGF